MYFDLNVPIHAQSAAPSTSSQMQQSKKSKGKQPAMQAATVSYTPAQLAKIEGRIDLLVQLGYTVIALSQTVETKIEPKTHVNILEPLFPKLRRRQGVLLLKRLTIILDSESEKGFGLTSSHSHLFKPYDILALQPTTQATFSSACLTHSLPSPLTTHVISLPLTGPRLPFFLKLTLVRTAVKNGGSFEINYAGALKGESERRNWWAAARELTRVTKGNGLVVSSGVESDVELRAPRDVGNLIVLLGLAPDIAHQASTTTPKALVLRTQTRKAYRAILSEPTLILPSAQPAEHRKQALYPQSLQTEIPTPDVCTPNGIESSTTNSTKRPVDALYDDPNGVSTAEQAPARAVASAGSNAVSMLTAPVPSGDETPAGDKKRKKKKRKTG